MKNANGLAQKGPMTTASTLYPRRPCCQIMDDASVVRASTLPASTRNSLFSSGSPNHEIERPIERCVVIAKHSDGYGLTVTSDNPVFVDSVKPDGAAFLAGVRKGDHIVKVNGMPVTRSNYHEVVRMISDGQTVALTLLSRSSDYPSRQSTSQCDFDYEIPKSEKDRCRRQIGGLNDMLQTERGFIEHQANPAIVEPVKSWVDSGGMHYIQAADIGGTEDDGDDEEGPSFPQNVDHGPFLNLGELKSRPAHMASFINYLLSNSTSSSLLFYLITDSYQTSNCSVKEIRRFAYEIFSTFLIPNAPLAMSNISQPLIHAIDKILKATVNATDQDFDQLRKIFVPARTKALDDINQCLADFRVKRQYVLEANQLDSIAKGDHAMEHRVSEQMLMRTLETLYNSTNADFENCEPRILALIMSVGTIIKVVYGMRPNLSSWEKLLERCPTFLTGIKSGVFKMKPMMSKRGVQIKGHNFVLQSVNLIVHCYQCREAVWGVNAQAYFCQNCDVSVHKQCTSQLVDHCYPATLQKTKAASNKAVKKPFTSSTTNLFSGPSVVSSHSRHESPVDAMRTSASSQPILANALRRSNMDHSNPELRTLNIHPTPPPPSIPPPPAQNLIPWSSSASAPPTENVKSSSSDSGIGTEVSSDRPVLRSQSCRTQVDVTSSSRNKPAPSSWTAGEPLGPPPDESYEEPIMTGYRRTDGDFEDRPPALLRAIEIGSVSGSSSLSQASADDEEQKKMLRKLESAALTEGDSDLDVDTEVPSLESLISWEVLRHLKPKEKKRQEVINELFHTEKTHVRNLKVIFQVFYKPLLVNKVVNTEVIKLIFSNLVEILEIHQEMKHKMKLAMDLWQRDPTLNKLYGDIGELMEGMFSGTSGERLMKATSTFCQHQQHALDYLRARYSRPKDDSFSLFLLEAESSPLCRKLQLKDMLPMEMQRLVKYPMLLETIAKYTKDPSPELTQLLNSVNSSKQILMAVNTAKRNAENFRRLDELQRRLDTTNIDRNDQFEAFFQDFDFTKHKLIYEGPLTWRISRTKMVDLHVVLLETLMVFLTKSDGSKLQLRVHEAGLTPLLKLTNMIVKDKANDKRAFSLLNRRDFRIFEFVAATATERKNWHRVIETQIQQNNQGTVTDDVSVPDVHFDDSPYRQNSPSRPLSVFEEKHLEHVHVVTHPRLVNANEIVIQQPTVFEHAQPILTPMERIRRDDKLIVDALVDKQKILATFLSEKKDASDLERMTELFSSLSVGELKQKSCKELAMSAIVQGNRLLDIINKGMSLKKDCDERIELELHDQSLPMVPCYKLTAISAHLMNHLMALLQVIQDQQNEMVGIKQQLYHYKDIAENGPGDRTVSEETLTEPPSQPPPLPPTE